jgi:hypothetical protein
MNLLILSVRTLYSCVGEFAGGSTSTAFASITVMFYLQTSDFDAEL